MNCNATPFDHFEAREATSSERSSLGRSPKGDDLYQQSSQKRQGGEAVIESFLQEMSRGSSTTNQKNSAQMQKVIEEARKALLECDEEAID